MNGLRIKDGHGRRINYLRLAVTDRCNLRCQYCMPAEGIDFLPRKELLSYEEMLRLVSIVSAAGVKKIRITGGEPFLKKDIDYFLRSLRQIDSLEKIHITTNGTLLDKYLDLLQDINIDGVNLSLDTLDEARFYEITRRTGLEQVKKMMDRLIEMSIPLKVNMVVMAGKNTQDILPMAELAKTRNIQVRFIEEMPFNGGSGLSGQALWSSQDILGELTKYFGAPQTMPAPHGATAQVYHWQQFQGSIGIIPAFSRTFCGQCNRMRITAQGKLKTCLYDSGVFDLKGLLRNGASDLEILNAIQDAFKHKAKDGFEAEKQLFNIGHRESMSTIGG